MTAHDQLPTGCRRLHNIADGCTGILLGRTTYEMFEPAWSQRTVEDDPGSAVLQRHHEVRRLGDAHRGGVEELARR
jgi:hypothetical protein